MGSKFKLPALFLLVVLHQSDGCSQLPACGIKADEIQLTDTPDTVHITMSRHNDCPTTYESFENFVDEGALESITVEVEVSSNSIRFIEFEFLAKAVNNPPALSDQPTVAQTWDLSYGEEGSSTVKVTTIDATNEYTLPSFVAPAEEMWDSLYEGVVAFNSDRFDRFYFLYVLKNGNIGVASCLNANNGACDFQEVPSTEYNIDDLERGSMRAQVYDDLQLVGLPVVCCLCHDYDYFVFDETGIVRSIPMLDDYLGKITNADPRNQMAYGVKDGGGIYGEDFMVRSESYDPNIPPGERTFATYELSFESLQTFFNTPTATTTPKTLSTTYSSTSLVYGNMFDVIGKNYVIVYGMNVHIADTENHNVEVYLRRNSGSFMNVQRHPAAWSLIGDISIQGDGAGMPTSIPFGSFDPVTIVPGVSQGFYVTLTDGKFMGQTQSQISTGQVYESNNDLSITVGVGKDYLFGNKYDAAVFNGEILYFVDEAKLASLEASSASSTSRRPYLENSLLPACLATMFAILQ